MYLHSSSAPPPPHLPPLVYGKAQQEGIQVHYDALSLLLQDPLHTWVTFPNTWDHLASPGSVPCGASIFPVINLPTGLSSPFAAPLLMFSTIKFLTKQTDSTSSTRLHPRSSGGQCSTPSGCVLLMKSGKYLTAIKKHVTIPAWLRWGWPFITHKNSLSPQVQTAALLCEASCNWVTGHLLVTKRSFGSWTWCWPDTRTASPPADHVVFLIRERHALSCPCYTQSH